MYPKKRSLVLQILVGIRTLDTNGELGTPLTLPSTTRHREGRHSPSGQTRLVADSALRVAVIW